MQSFHSFHSPLENKASFAASLFSDLPTSFAHRSIRLNNGLQEVSTSTYLMTASCASLANNGYDPDTGARSLNKVVTKMVSENFVPSYLENKFALVPQPLGASLKRFVVKVRTAGEEQNPILDVSVTRDGIVELKFERSKRSESLFIDDEEVCKDDGHRCRIVSDDEPCIAIDHGPPN